MAKKGSAKIRWKFSKRISVLILFLIIGLGLFTYIINKPYYDNQTDIKKSGSATKTELKGEIQELNHESPVFQESNYNSRMIGTVLPGSIEVLNTDGEWKQVDTEYGVGWVPTEDTAYNLDSELILDIPSVHQFPELINGCEAVSVLMMLSRYGFSADKVDFAKSIPHDYTQVQFNGNDISVWGDPKKGFVGDVTGNYIGYGIDPEPLVEFLYSYLETPVNLTGVNPEILDQYIRAGNPVVVWVTVNFTDRYSYIEWDTSSGETIDASFDTHAMTMVGFDEDNYYLNDPYTGTKAYKVSRERFQEVWSQMGKKALSAE